MEKCHHEYQTRYQNVVAQFQKRVGDQIFYCDGDYQECPLCFTGRFIPYLKKYKTVECLITKRFEMVDNPTDF